MAISSTYRGERAIGGKLENAAGCPELPELASDHDDSKVFQSKIIRDRQAAVSGVLWLAPDAGSSHRNIKRFAAHG
jgi:hypothetical protein